MLRRFSFALASCLATTAGLVAQTTINLPYELTIQPIFVGNGSTLAVQDNAALLSKMDLFQDATQKIFAQAGVRVNWLTPNSFHDAAFYTINDISEVDHMATIPGFEKNADVTVLNMWFVGSINGGVGLSRAINWENSLLTTAPNGVTIAESVFFNDWLAVIAHEIGHNLGLAHEPGNLMSETVETSATSLDVLGWQPGGGPHGPYGLLTGAQIARIHENPTRFVALDGDTSLIRLNDTPGDFYEYSPVPEPHHYALCCGATIGVLAWWRRLRPARQKV